MKNKICNNYFSGSVNQISNCLEIILYNKSSFTERISLYNLESFYLSHLVGTSDDFVKLFRDKSREGEKSIPFEYKKMLKNGFNIIVYISPVSNSPIGYSEFVNTQGAGVSLGITINITRTHSEEIELILNNQLTGKDLSKSFLGNEPYNYVRRKELIDKNYRNLFTSDVGRLNNDDFSFILGSSWAITKEHSWKVELKRNIELIRDYKNFNVCFYNGFLVLATWEDDEYILYYLTNSDSERIEGNTNGIDIKHIEGRYYLDTEGQLRDIETGNIIVNNNGNLFCDYLDPHCKLYDLPTFYSKSEILKYIPEINNIYLDLDNYLRSNQITVYGKIGSWFILSRDFGGTSIYTAISPTTYINMTEEDLERAIFIGDQTMILVEDDEDLVFPYYVVYNTEGIELSTERARTVLLNGRFDLWSILDDNNTPSNPNDDFYINFRFCFLDTDEDEVHYSEYYGDNGLVHLVFRFEELHSTELGKYRRNVYPEHNEIPKFIGSFGGIIFYKINNKINWL